MAIQFFDGSRRPTPPATFISCPPTCHVRIMCPPSGIVKVWLHWNGSRSVPCLGDECEYCPDPPTLNGYAQALVGVWDSRKFSPVRWGILSITEAAFDVCDRDARGEVLEMSRKGRSSRGRLSLVKVGEDRSLAGEPFSLLEKLNSMWSRQLAGIRRSKERMAAEIQERLRVIGSMP